MIKALVFDYVGVLVRDQDGVLSDLEDQIERGFGANHSDEEFQEFVKGIDPTIQNVDEIARWIMDKLYVEREPALWTNIQKEYPQLKLAIATNHISWVRGHILLHFPCEKVFISAEMHCVKPEAEFFEQVCQELQLSPHEILFLDDSMKNIEGAEAVGMHVLKVEREMQIEQTIAQYFSVKK